MEPPDKFDTFWKENLSLMPGVPLNIEDRDKMKKLVRRMYDEITSFGQLSYERGFENGNVEGYNEGHDDGYREGYDTGYNEGCETKK